MLRWRKGQWRLNTRINDYRSLYVRQLLLQEATTMNNYHTKDVKVEHDVTDHEVTTQLANNTYHIWQVLLMRI